MVRIRASNRINKILTIPLCHNPVKDTKPKANLNPKASPDS
jgi:hypothetical protein